MQIGHQPVHNSMVTIDSAYDKLKPFETFKPFKALETIQTIRVTSRTQTIWVTLNSNASFRRNSRPVHHFNLILLLFLSETNSRSGQKYDFKIGNCVFTSEAIGESGQSTSSVDKKLFTAFVRTLTNYSDGYSSIENPIVAVWRSHCRPGTLS